MTDQFYSRESIEIIQSNFNSQEHQFIIVKKKNKKRYMIQKIIRTLKFLQFRVRKKF